MLCNKLTWTQANRLYVDVLKSKKADDLRRLCTKDLFFLLTVALNRRDANRLWIYERCREVESDPDGRLDLWAREHYKSTIITYAKTIQDILDNSELTVGIFSHTRPIAKGFLNQIKREFELNTFLIDLFPDVLYREPRRESPRWSLDNGIVVKRKSNPKESTVEAWGLVDGQPTSKHFQLKVYDDVVTRESVTSPEQIQKVTDAWALSLNLGTEGGRDRYIGTRYHLNDTYKTIIERDAAQPRIRTATEDGTPTGRPVLFDAGELQKRRDSMGPYIFAAQMLQNPLADIAMGFQEDWLRFYNKKLDASGWNVYVLVDPANEKKKDNDYTVILVIGLSYDQNYYLLDGVRDRMNLTERTEKVFSYVRLYNPVKVGYEKYGMQSDIQHIQYVMDVKNYRFSIEAVGGSVPKNDRIRQLVPVFEQFRMWLPKQLLFVDYESRVRDFVNLFIEDEYTVFPVGTHDDMLDCMARIMDPGFKAEFPENDPRYKVSQTVETPATDMAQTEYELFE